MTTAKQIQKLTLEFEAVFNKIHALTAPILTPSVEDGVAGYHALLARSHAEELHRDLHNLHDALAKDANADAPRRGQDGASA